MGLIKITADSTCDLSEDIIKDIDAHIMRLYVSLGDKTYRDGGNINPQMIYDFVAKEKILPKTAAPSPEDYNELFAKYANNCDAVIHFNISSLMSASNQNAKIAAQNFKNVYVVDSLSLSTGTALLMLKTDELIKKGKKAADIVKELEEIKPKVQASFVVDTLEYLHKGGRCSGLAKLGATIFKIHPLLLVKKGSITVHKKLRGKISFVYADYLDELKKEFSNPETKFAFVTHTEIGEEDLQAFINKARELYKFEKLYVTAAGCTITSHCGKGTVGLLFINGSEI